MRVAVVAGRASQRSGQQLIASTSASLANTVSINGCAATACKSSNSRTLFTSRYAADERARAKASGRGQLIAVFLPKTSSMPVPITDARVMRMGDIAMPMAYVSAGSG